MDIHALSLSDVTRRTKSGELSARGVAEAMLARIAEKDRELGAYVSVDEERVLQTADVLDERRRRGEPLGPLHGAPIALKDLLWTKGVATSCGTAVMADWRPDEDATVVTRLEAAGALVLGKVKLTEGAFGEHHPSVSPPLNPWNASRWTGVSSSGSGVAVAAGMAHGAIGTDTGGSIRFPSAACGLVGVKPTYGRVSRYGAFPLADSLDHVGPMTRGVEDAARMLQAMAGHDPLDETSAQAPVPAYASFFLESLAGVKVGVDWHYVREGVDESVHRLIDNALALLRSIGAEIVDVEIPNTDVLVDNWMVTCGVECARAHAAFFPDRKDEYGPALAGLIEGGLAATPAEYERLQQERLAFRSGLDAALQGIDALIAPCLVAPVPAAERSVPRRPGSPRFIRFTAPFDYSGHPSVTLPMDVDAEGLPRAFQLIGEHFAEGRLLGIAHAIEQATQFQYPTLA